jgi:uncharacterized glyoxalase superfamily protein PhnB
MLNRRKNRMLSNRSIPRVTVIPVLAYPDVNQAAGWLCDAFGFTVRLRIGAHRVQLNVGDGAVIVREMRPNEENAVLGLGYSVTIRVEDVDAHCQKAKDQGVRITQAPVTYPYGERQYNADDFAGHSWTFSQSVADVHPQEWGGEAEQL